MKIAQLTHQKCWHGLAAGFVLSIGLIANPAVKANDTNAEADQILQAMSTYLAGTDAFSVNADIDFEVVDRYGQKLQFSSFATLVMQRPNQFHMQRRGSLADIDFFFDGEVLTLYGNRNNVYAQIPLAGTIDDAILAYELETGIPAPGADLLFANPYEILSSGVDESAYIGTAYVNGVECHHLAFREANVDWQIWVQTGDRPLPMKYVITSTWVTGAPQYEIRFRDWNTNPQIDPGAFTFTIPEGARRLEGIPLNEWNELLTPEEGEL